MDLFQNAYFAAPPDSFQAFPQQAFQQQHGIDHWYLPPRPFDSLHHFRAERSKIKECLKCPYWSLEPQEPSVTFGSDLPSCIELTTAEILIYFPGYITDPFFTFRCINAGWTPKAIRAVLKDKLKHYKQILTEAEVEVHMSKVLTIIIGDPNVTWSAYIDNLPQELRDKGHKLKYDKTGFAAPKVFGCLLEPVRTNDVRANDPKLTWLREKSPFMPPLEDRGTFSNLMGPVGSHRWDCRMSEIPGLVAHDYRWSAKRVAWGVNEDMKSAKRWNEFAELGSQ